MLSRNTDRDWQLFGKVDPYWAVSPIDQLHRHNLTEHTLREFFASGEGHVASIFRLVRRHLESDFRPASALDFGCGVGRVLIPLARECQSVVGVDMSPGMLQEAQGWCASLGLSNVRLITGDDRLSGVAERFDFVHSYIVLQHIPPVRGTNIAWRLLQLLNDGGVGAVHFTYAHHDPNQRSRHPRLRTFLRTTGLLPSYRAGSRSRPGFAQTDPHEDHVSADDADELLSPEHRSHGSPNGRRPPDARRILEPPRMPGCYASLQERGREPLPLLSRPRPCGTPSEPSSVFRQDAMRRLDILIGFSDSASALRRADPPTRMVAQPFGWTISCNQSEATESQLKHGSLLV